MIEKNKPPTGYGLLLIVLLLTPVFSLAFSHIFATVWNLSFVHLGFQALTLKICYFATICISTFRMYFGIYKDPALDEEAVKKVLMRNISFIIFIWPFIQLGKIFL